MWTQAVTHAGTWVPLISLLFVQWTTRATKISVRVTDTLTLPNCTFSSCLMSEQHVCVLWATVTLANTSLQLADAAAVYLGSFFIANRLVSSGAVAGQPAGSPPVCSTETLLSEELLWRMSDRRECAEDQKWGLQNYSHRKQTLPDLQYVS